MASILRIKDKDGIWHDIPSVRGLSAYEIALQNGFEGTEEEWIKKTEEEARKAEEARLAAGDFADQALQSAQNAALSEESAYTQSNRAYDQAERAMEYANASGESSSSSLAFSEQAREHALASDESATSSHTFAEEAKASADKAEMYATQLAPAYAYVDIRGGIENWKAENITDNNGNVIGTRYGQVVEVKNADITANSMVDLRITSEQMVVFYEKSLAFTAENDGGEVTIYCVGSIPQNDYTIQAKVTEVAVNG